jgi:hypothetical protein
MPRARSAGAVPRSGDVVDVVVGEVGGVPGDGAVVGVVVQDGQAVVGGGGGDDEVDCGSAAVLAGACHPVLNGGDPAAGVLRDCGVGVEVGELSEISSYSAAPRAL